MTSSQLRLRCEERLRDLELPDPFDVSAFCSELSTQRGRSIQLTPARMPSGMYGAWIAGANTDYVFYEQETSLVHQEHIVLHEVGHLLCGHQPGPLLSEHALPLLPNLDRDMVRRVLGRTIYTAEEEREAELLASLISQRALRPTNSRPTGASPRRAALLGRLEETLERPA